MSTEEGSLDRHGYLIQDALHNALFGRAVVLGFRGKHQAVGQYVAGHALDVIGSDAVPSGDQGSGLGGLE